MLLNLIIFPFQSRLDKDFKWSYQSYGNFSGDSNLKTSNGKIEVAGLIKDSFTAKTSNGSVDIDVNRPESSIQYTEKRATVLSK